VVRALGFSAAIFLTACGAILGIPDVNLDNSIGQDAGGDAQKDVITMGDAPSETGDAPVESTCGNTMSDSKNCGACGHDCLGGACMMGQCQPVLITNNSNLVAPFSMTQTSSDLVFTNLRGGACATPCNSARIGKGLTMGSATILADYVQYSAPLDGQPYAITQDGTNFFVGIHANGATNGKWFGGLDKCPLMSGCPSKTIGVPGVVSLAIDTDGMSVFYGIRYDDVTFTTHYELQRAALDYSSPMMLATLADDVAGVVVSGNDLFYSDGSKGIYRCTKTMCMGNIGLHLNAVDIPAFGLAVNQTDVFFVGSASIERVSKSGGGDAQIKNMLNVPFGIAVDSGYVYFTDIGNTQNPADGKVVRCPLTGCTPQTEVTLATGDNPRPIVTDNVAIYWGARTGKIFRLAK